MTKPDSKPSDVFTWFSARTTGTPSPSAPTSAAITTIDSDSMMVWFSPAMICGMAYGNSTFHSTWRLVAPADLLLTYALLVRALKLAGYTVIGDRYVWDALVDRKMYHDDARWMERAIRRGFQLLGAKPDQALLFSLPLQISQARSEAKDEPFPDPPELRARRHNLYQALQAEPRMITIEADRPVADIAAEISALLPPS